MNFRRPPIQDPSAPLSWHGFLLPILLQWSTWIGLPFWLCLLILPPTVALDAANPALRLVLELPVVVFASQASLIAWNVFPRNRQRVVLLAACGFLCVALLELFYVVTIPGLLEWANPDSSLDRLAAVQLAAHAVTSLTLMGMVMWPHRPTAPGLSSLRQWAMLWTLVFSLVLAGGIFWGVQAYPGLFFNAAGDTQTQKVLEILLVAANGLTLMILVRKQPQTIAAYDPRCLASALFTLMASRLVIVSHSGHHPHWALVGYLLEDIAFYQLYRAWFVHLVSAPYSRIDLAEADLRLSESNFKALYDASPDGILVVNAAGLIVQANPQATLMFGHPVLAGMPLSLLLPPALRERHEGHCTRYLAEGCARLMGQGRSRFRALRRDGGEFTVEVGLSPVTLTGHREVIATVRDVSVREQLEQQLETSEARLRNFIDNAVDWVWEVDTAGLFTYSSRSVQGLLGYAPEDCIGQSLAGFMAVEDARRFQRIWAELQKRQRPLTQLEHLNTHRDGQWVLLETSGMPYYDGAGNWLGYRGISRDVTHRNEIQQALSLSEQRFRLAFDHSPIGMGMGDIHGAILKVNNTLCRMLGYSEAEFTGKKVLDFAHPGDFENSYALRQALYAGQISVATFEMRYRHKAGHFIWTHVALGLVGEPGQPTFVLAQIHDFSKEWACRQHNNQLLSIVECTDVAVITLTREGQATYINSAARQLMGISVDEAVSHLRLEDFHAPDVARHLLTYVLPQAERAGRWEGEAVWLARNGEAIPVSQVFIAHRPGTDGILSWSLLARDLREIRMSEARLNYLGTHDALTTLPNRTLICERLQQALARARQSGRLVAIMLIDIDQFKRINDSLSHASGDVILRVLARRLREVLGEAGSLARQGGDEFIVLLPEVPLVQDIVQVADQLLACFDEAIPVQDHDLRVTASIGISAFPFDHDDPDELLRKADVAMYRAKSQGGHAYQFYTEEMDQNFREDMAVEALLHYALERQQLKLHYQPKFELASGRLVGFEALLRWHHPALGVIPPSRFIPLAERSKLIVSLGEWAMRSACQQMVAWQREGLSPGHVAVNVSCQQFEHSNVAAMICKVLAETGLSAECLELEITESVLMRDPQLARQMLEEIRALQVSIAIDDFGTGYSSLSYLKRFPVNVLKIDRSFVQEITTNKDDAAIVHAIISMAGALNIEVVAEGIETQEQLDFLRACGCQFAQGYLLGYPVSAESACSLLAS